MVYCWVIFHCNLSSAFSFTVLGLRFNQAAYMVAENVDSGVVTINLELVSMVPDHGNPTEADIWVTLEATKRSRR